MPPWFATLDGYAILASANFGFAQDDRLSYRFAVTLTLASPECRGGLLGAAKDFTLGDFDLRLRKGITVGVVRLGRGRSGVGGRTPLSALIHTKAYQGIALQRRPLMNKDEGWVAQKPPLQLTIVQKTLCVAVASIFAVKSPPGAGVSQFSRLRHPRCPPSG